MFRLVLLSLLATTISAGCNHGHNHHRHHHEYTRNHQDDGDFHELSWAIVGIDRKVQRLCNAHNEHLTETFFNNYYKIAAALPGYAVDDITVKIKHRVLLVQAVKGGQLFSEVKVLPEIVNTNDSAWSYKDGKLAVEFSYRYPLGTEVVKTCDAPINDAVIDILMSPDIDARFGNEETNLDENVVV